MSRRVSFIHGSGSGGALTPGGRDGPGSLGRTMKRPTPPAIVRAETATRAKFQMRERRAHRAQRKWFLLPTLRTSAPDAPQVEHGMIPRATASFSGMFSTGALYGSGEKTTWLFSHA